MLVRPDTSWRLRPQLVIAHSELDYVAAVERLFRQHGWSVATADSGPQARRLALHLNPDLVVLEAELPAESGWLTCAKLRGEAPDTKVVLVAGDDETDTIRFADFVGADRLVSRAQGARVLLDETVAPALTLAQ